MESGRRTFYLGRYNCVEPLGTGPLGDTYRAKIYGVAGFEKQFAVKRLHAHLNVDEPFLARFVPVASAFAQLEHPRIARVHEVNAQGSHYYIVIDLVHGLDLRRILELLRQRGEALAPDLAMLIACDVADGLEYAHSRTNILPNGVLHLGLTAQSVMVTYEGEVKLVDVGLLASLIRPGWSADDSLAPTLAYLSPEELRGDGIDGRADLFSLGVVLHELLSGSRLFLSDRAEELRAAIEAGPPPPPPADPRLQQIVSCALNPDRERRFRDASEMRAALQTLLAGRAERARAELSTLIRRLAAPRERRTGAFAAVTLPPPVSETVTPVSPSRPPPLPPHVWAPPAARPPSGPTLSSVPTHNTLAGLGADDAELTPIELIELPPSSTEKPLLEVSPEQIESAEMAASPSATPAPANAPIVLADGWTIESVSQAAIASASAPEAEPNPIATSEKEPLASVTEAVEPAPAPANLQVAPEASWNPPVVEPPLPSPEPVFAEHRQDEHSPVERPSSPVPGVKLPPRQPRNHVPFTIIAVLLIGGAIAVYEGLNGGDTAKPVPYSPTTQPLTVEATPAGTQPANGPSGASNAPAAVPVPITPTTKVEAPATNTETPAIAKVEPPATRVEAPPTVKSEPLPTVKSEPIANTSGEPEANPAATKPVLTMKPNGITKIAVPPPPMNNTAPTAAAETPTVSPVPNIAGGASGVEIVTTPAGAQLFVDGQPHGMTPAHLDIAPGKHHLVIAAEHHKLIKRDVVLSANEPLRIALEPATLPPEIVGSAGLKVRCKTQGELRVLVDGADSGVSCPNDARISVKPGPHKIGLYSPRTDETHEIEHDVVDGNNSTRVYTKY